MQEKLTLNAKEQKRLKASNMVERGGLKMKEGGKVMGPSVRQVRRLCAAYREEEAIAAPRSGD